MVTSKRLHARLLQGLAAVASAASFAGCGGKTQVETARPITCVTSFACATGARCDDGQCVPDVACPGPIAPRVVYSTSEAQGEIDGALVVLNGREYWEGPIPFGGDTETSFIDLVTHVRSMFPHSLGDGSCWGDPPICGFTPRAGGSEVFETGVHLDAATQTWVGTESIAIPVGWSAFAMDQPAPGQWLLSSRTAVAVWAPPGNPPTPLFALNSNQLLVGVVDAPGRPKMIATVDHSQLKTTVSAAPLIPGSTLTTLFTVDAIRAYAVPVPAGDGGWFLVRDLASGGDTFYVERSNAQGQSSVGSTTDPMVSAVAERYRLGAPALDDGTRGKGVLCANDTCRTGEVDLATLAQKAVGSTTLPGVTELHVRDERWLACDAVEVLAFEPLFNAGGDAGAATAARMHVLRVLANAP